MSGESGQEPIQTADKQGNPDKKGNQSQDEIASVKVMAESRAPTPLPHSINNPAESKNEANPSIPHPPNWCEKWTLWLEVAGVLGLAFYCWVNWREWRTFDSERQTMEREFLANQSSALANYDVAIRQLKSMQEQSDAMQMQLDEMRQTRFTDERAWVIPSVGDNVLINTATNVFIFQTQIKNEGKTPAIIIGTFVGQTGNINSIPQNDPDVTPTSGILSPSESLTLKSSQIPTQAVIGIANKIPWYIYGSVLYEDVFGHRHLTRFCVALSGNETIPVGLHNSFTDIGGGDNSREK